MLILAFLGITLAFRTESHYGSLSVKEFVNKAKVINVNPNVDNETFLGWFGSLRINNTIVMLNDISEYVCLDKVKAENLLSFAQNGRESLIINEDSSLCPINILMMVSLRHNNIVLTYVNYTYPGTTMETLIRVNPDRHYEILGYNLVNEKTLRF